MTLARKGKVLCRRQTYFNIGVASARGISYIEWLLVLRISFLCFFVLHKFTGLFTLFVHSNASVTKSSYCVTPRSLTACYPPTMPP